jgi:hypothetical protein
MEKQPHKNPVISKELLVSAKAFLCWEAVENLSVQLVPVQNAVAYYYPPQNVHHAIVIFFQPSASDFSEPLFLLFHEAGHALQYMRLCEQNREDYFQKMIDLDRGIEKMDFEKEAWAAGRDLLLRFLQKKALDLNLLAKFDLYSRACTLSYRES